MKLDDAEHVHEVLRQNRRATIAAAIGAVVAANVVFWGIGFGLPGVELGALVIGGAAAAAGLVGAGLYFALRSRKDAFSIEVPKPVRPSLSDDELRVLRKELTGATPIRPPESTEPEIADLGTDVADTVRRVQAIQRRNLFAGFVSSTIGLMSGGGSLVAIDWVYERGNEGRLSFEQVHVGGQEILVALFVGVAIGMAIYNRLRSPHDPLGEEPAVPFASDPDAFARGLAVTGRLTMAKAPDATEALTGLAGRARYDVLDGGSALLCTVEEKTHLLSRLLPAALRRYEAELRDADRRLGRIVRTGLLSAEAEVSDEDGLRLGAIAPSLLSARRLSIAGPDGTVRYRIRGRLLSRRRFAVLKGSEVVGEIHRPRRSFFASPLTVGERSELTLPKDASLDDRRLLLAAVIYLDARA